MIMNTDKAYIMGLLVGGGRFSSDRKQFYIRLPYKQWGEIDKNPERAGVIANDILRVVKPLMAVTYGLDVTYQVGRDWKIVCCGDTQKLIEDLNSVGIEPTAEIHKYADLSKLIDILVDANMKRRFVAGIADTIGSMTPSQRRFSDDVQIISFEISGFNYRFVCQLCNLLYELGCVPDQILWQHPNMQSGTDAYYTQWKKGNKLRVTLDSFSVFGSLAFKCKAEASRQNLLREKTREYNDDTRCETKTLSVPGVVAYHVDENYSGIPEEIRGGHYIHHKQICATLGCPHAPYAELERLFMGVGNYISPFTVLHKDDVENIESIINNDELLRNRTYTNYKLYVKDVVNASAERMQTLAFINGMVQYQLDRSRGYPLNVVLDAIAFIIASKTGKLNGKRPRGSREIILRDTIRDTPDFWVEVKVPDLLTPIIITDGRMAAMVSPLNAEVYNRLVSYSEVNKYKLVLRKITEEDLR